MMEQGHLCRHDTVAALMGLYDRFGSLKLICNYMGLRPSMKATISAVLRRIPGGCSVEYENLLRAKLGLESVANYTVPACPDCGGLHALYRCCDKVGELKIIAPYGSRRGNRLRRQHITISEKVFSIINEARVESGLEWEHFLCAMLSAYTISQQSVALQTHLPQEPDRE